MENMPPPPAWETSAHVIGGKYEKMENVKENVRKRR
jgi:hypothetical protein